MSVYSIYFSPTGGTEKVMKLLVSAWDNVTTVDLSIPDTDYENYRFSAEDICVIGIPVFEGRVPKIALDRISRMKADHTPAVLVAVYGNRDFNDALLELKNQVILSGFYPTAAVTAIAHHSIFSQYAQGRPDEQDAKELKSFSTRLKTLVKTNNPHPVDVPGKEPYIEIPLSPVYPLFNPQKCVHCMLCAQKCPAQAIDPDTLDLNQDICARCMRCTCICPTGARYLDPTLQETAKRLAKLFEGRKPNVLYQ